MAKSSYALGDKHLFSDADLLVDSIKIQLLDPTTYGLTVTAATNASPIDVTTSAVHGLAVGDEVIISGIIGNKAANGVWKVASVPTTSRLTLNRPDGGTTMGSGAYTSGGYLIKLSKDEFLSDIPSGARLSLSAALTTKSLTVTTTGLVFDADDPPTISSWSGNPCLSYAMIKDTGTASTSPLIDYNDGKFIVTAANLAVFTLAAAPGNLAVRPLRGALKSGDTLAFSGGKIATLAADAAEDDETISVTGTVADTISRDERAEGFIPGTGFYPTGLPAGANVNLTFNNGASKIFEQRREPS